jgi:predicted amidohydrolase
VGLDSDSLTRVAALAAELRVAVALPYAELASQSRLFNSCALFDATGALAANYRKVSPPSPETSRLGPQNNSKGGSQSFPLQKPVRGCFTACR